MVIKQALVGLSNLRSTICTAFEQLASADLAAATILIHTEFTRIQTDSFWKLLFSTVVIVFLSIITILSSLIVMGINGNLCDFGMCCVNPGSF